METLGRILMHPATLPVIGAGAAWLASKVLGAKRWASVRKKAHEIIGDKADPIDDPRRAVEKALTDAMRAEIAKQAARVARTHVVNGMNP